MVTLCDSELHSQHHNQAGYGTVKNPEHILYAVFDTTKVRDGKLYQASFDSRQLRDNDLSVCRVTHTVRNEFDTCVVKARNVLGGGLLTALAIRNITFREPENDEGAAFKKALCVHDRVLPEEYDGHATLAYASFVTEIANEKTRGSACARIRGTLAQLMQPILPLEEVPFRVVDEPEADDAVPAPVGL